MNRGRSRPSPYAAEAVAILVTMDRDGGLPLADQMAAETILTCEATAADKRDLVLAYAMGTLFTASDPTLWADARAALATVATLVEAYQRGDLDEPTYRARTGALVIRYAPDTWLAVIHLYRSRLVAQEHAMRLAAADTRKDA